MKVSALIPVILLSLLPVSAATVDTGTLLTSYYFTGGDNDPPLTAVDVSTSATVDLSDLTGLTPGYGIAITFSTTENLHAENGFLADDGDLTVSWHALFTLTAGDYSVSSEEMWSLGPLPWVGSGSETVGFETGPIPQSFSLVVPWGTDLSAVTLTMTDLYSVTGTNTQVTLSSLEIGSASLSTESFFSGSPEIELSGNGVDIENDDESPDAADGTDFGILAIGDSPAIHTFTITNSGDADLVLGGSPLVQLDGSGAFNIGEQPVASIVGAGGGVQTFTIVFDPDSSGFHSTIVSITNDDPDENPFAFLVSGRALSSSDDTDEDGLNDAAEFKMAALGFDWQVAQPALVGAYYENANAAGLYTPSQVQALHVGTPLIQRNADTGLFKLTIGVAKSTDLVNFAPFPMTAPQTAINGDGELEFEFTSPDDAAFFRVEAD